MKKVTLQQTEKLLKDVQKFNLLAFSMLITHWKEIYAKNPSQQTLEACTTEINTFLERFAKIMVADLPLIEKL